MARRKRIDPLRLSEFDLDFATGELPEGTQVDPLKEVTDIPLLPPPPAAPPPEEPPKPPVTPPLPPVTPTAPSVTPTPIPTVEPTPESILSQRQKEAADEVLAGKNPVDVLLKGLKSATKDIGDRGLEAFISTGQLLWSMVSVISGVFGTSAQAGRPVQFTEAQKAELREQGLSENDIIRVGRQLGMEQATGGVPPIPSSLEGLGAEEAAELEGERRVSPEGLQDRINAARSELAAAAQRGGDLIQLSRVFVDQLLLGSSPEERLEMTNRVINFSEGMFRNMAGIMVRDGQNETQAFRQVLANRLNQGFETTDDVVSAEMATRMLQTAIALEGGLPESMKVQLQHFIDVNEAIRAGEVGEELGFLHTKVLEQFPGLATNPTFAASLQIDGFLDLEQQRYQRWLDAGNVGSFEDFIDDVGFSGELEDMAAQEQRDSMTGLRSNVLGKLEDLGIDKAVVNDILGTATGGTGDELVEALLKRAAELETDDVEALFADLGDVQLAIDILVGDAARDEARQGELSQVATFVGEQTGLSAGESSLLLEAWTDNLLSVIPDSFKGSVMGWVEAHPNNVTVKAMLADARSRQEAEITKGQREQFGEARISYINVVDSIAGIDTIVATDAAARSWPAIQEAFTASGIEDWDEFLVSRLGQSYLRLTTALAKDMQDSRSLDLLGRQRSRIRVERDLGIIEAQTDAVPFFLGLYPDADDQFDLIRYTPELYDMWQALGAEGTFVDFMNDLGKNYFDELLKGGRAAGRQAGVVPQVWIRGRQ